MMSWHMNEAELMKQWKEEEKCAFQGWDFSHINGRWVEPGLPWDYKAVVQAYLKSTDTLLDMGTGGGEVLLTLNHPYKNTYATEAYAPNFELCKKVLSPLGITIVQTFTDENFHTDNKLPFDEDFFDVVINRHEDFELTEINRVLRQGGYFITQQVGNQNTNEFIQRLNDADFAFDRSHHTMDRYIGLLKQLGFQMVKVEEAKYPIRVYDVGAFVYYAKIIVWEYPGFSVKTHMDKLLNCQREIEEKGFLGGTGHRFLIVARKL